MTAIVAPSLIVGGGNNGAVNVLRVRFPNAALAGAPYLEAWTAAGSPPTLTLGANADAPFYTSDSSVYAIPTYGQTAGALANWAEDLVDDNADKFSVTPGYSAGGKKLQGANSVLQLVPNAVTSFPQNTFTPGFNLAYRLGPNTSTTPGANAFVLACRYIFTGGTDPLVVWEANSDQAGGTDNSPQWRSLAGADSDFTSGTPVRRIVHGNLGADPTNPVITRPSSGNVWSKALIAQATS